MEKGKKGNPDGMYVRFLDGSFSLQVIEIDCNSTCDTIPCGTIDTSPLATLLVMIFAPSPLADITITLSSK